MEDDDSGAAGYEMGDAAERSRRTLRLVFSIACERVFPKRRVMGGNAIGNGYWYSMAPEGNEGEQVWAAPCSASDAAKIVSDMQSLIQQDLTITDEEVEYQQVVSYFKEAGQQLALNQISRRVPMGGTVRAKCCSVQGTRHLRLSLFPLLPSTSSLSFPFTVQPYSAGGLMLVQGAKLVDQPALSQAVGEHKRWAHAAGIVGASDFCDVCEHDSKQALLVHAAEARLGT
jgi:hypothetical protein